MCLLRSLATCSAVITRKPGWAKTSKAERVFYIRMNNSTRALPGGQAGAEEIAAYCADRWPDAPLS